MATVYLSPTGDDSRSYAQAQNPATPWATIAKVQASATTGDTVICAAGTYTFPSSLTQTKVLTFQAATGATVIWDGAGGSVAWYMRAALTLIDIQVCNCSNAYYNGIFTVDVTAALTVTLTRCGMYNNLVYGVDYADGLIGVPSNVSPTLTLVLTACKFYANGSGNTTGVRGLIGMGGGTLALTMNNCMVYHSATGAAAWNCLIGMRNADKIASITMRNNIFQTVSSIPFRATAGSLFDSCDYAYNCAYNVSSMPAGSNNLTSDPLFVDPANGNFNLRPTSPCLDAGTLI